MQLSRETKSTVCKQKNYTKVEPLKNSIKVDELRELGIRDIV